MEIANIISPASGLKVRNQFIITEGAKKSFKSYQTMIAEYEDNKLTLDTNATEYSQTTSKWLYHFIREVTGTTAKVNKASLMKAIKQGRIAVKALN
jgi:aminopeptidase-like protein